MHYAVDPPVEQESLDTFRERICAMIHYIELLRPETRTTAELAQLRDLFIGRLAGGQVLMYARYVVGYQVVASNAYLDVVDDLADAARIYLDALPVMGIEADRELAALLGGAA